jgi:hypothetical protein
VDWSLVCAGCGIGGMLVVIKDMVGVPVLSCVTCDVNLCLQVMHWKIGDKATWMCWGAA